MPPSTGWPTAFNQWYGICETAVPGDKLSVNDAAANMLHKELQKFGGGSKPDQI
jgi:hypothetical protein